MKQLNTKNAYIILWVSLLAMGLGQLLLSFGRDFVAGQKPIDWAHWLLLVGAVGAAASFLRMQQGTLGRVARLFVVLGAVGFTGMVAIDILLWTIPEAPAVDDAIDIALDSPAVAVPFLWVGPSLLFMGIALKALEWWRQSTWAAALTLVGTLLNGFGQATRSYTVILLSFVLMLVGLAGLWANKDSQK